MIMSTSLVPSLMAMLTIWSSSFPSSSSSLFVHGYVTVVGRSHESGQCKGAGQYAHASCPIGSYVVSASCDCSNDKFSNEGLSDGSGTYGTQPDLSIYTKAMYAASEAEQCPAQDPLNYGGPGQPQWRDGRWCTCRNKKIWCRSNEAKVTLTCSPNNVDEDTYGPWLSSKTESIVAYQGDQYVYYEDVRNTLTCPHGLYVDPDHTGCICEGTGSYLMTSQPETYGDSDEPNAWLCECGTTHAAPVPVTSTVMIHCTENVFLDSGC